VLFVIPAEAGIQMRDTLHEMRAAQGNTKKNFREACSWLKNGGAKPKNT